jgi:membrane-associated PAP2 superfamily phosphatase
MKRPSSHVWWLLGALVALALLLFLFETNNWDIALQDKFYDRARAAWVVDRTEPVGRWIFYDGPKYVIGAVAFGVLGLALGPDRWRQRFTVERRDLWVAFLTLLTVPLLIGQLKDATNVFCPRQNRRYGGDVPYVRVFESYPENDRPARRGACFPAGHSSGGFALIGLLWLRRTRRWRAGAITAAMLIGWSMGVYQMLNGAHYLSHTITTMNIAIILTLVWRLVLPERPADH